jgi:nifR3 family TIM-barrel protein
MDDSRPIIGLAPMADFTDLPFCRLIRDIDKQSVIFREMVSAEALVRDNRKTLELCKLEQYERPVVQQLFGSDPAVMAKAAALICEKFAPDGIDINMGCPVHKAVSQFNGASLMKDPERAADIVKAVKSAINVPLSVKTRLGWSDPNDIIKFAKILEQAGADALEIHARTKEQGYSGKADWSLVKPVAQALKIPVLINGDITDPESAVQALTDSGAAGLLVGRGALGRPWILDRIRKAMHGMVDPGDPDLNERLRLLRLHAKYQIEHYGQNGLIKLRKHFPWYFKSIPGFRKYREQAVKVETMEDIDALTENLFASPFTRRL